MELPLYVSKYFDSNALYHPPSGFVFYESDGFYNVLGYNKKFINNDDNMELLDQSQINHANRLGLKYDSKIPTFKPNVIIIWPTDEYEIHSEYRTVYLHHRSTQYIQTFGYDFKTSEVIAYSKEPSYELEVFPLPYYRKIKANNLGFTVKNFHPMENYQVNEHLPKLPRVIISKILFEYLNDPVILELPDKCFHGEQLEIIQESRKGFLSCCKSGIVKACQLLCDFSDFTYNFERGFQEACYAGHIDIVKWLIKRKDFDVSKYSNQYELFSQVCYFSHVDIADLLCIIFSFLNELKYRNGELFANICRCGNIKIVQWFLNKYKNNIHEYSDLAFRVACVYGNFHIAKLLYMMGSVNIHSNNNEAFLGSKMRGHLDIFEWLISLDPNIVLGSIRSNIKYKVLMPSDRYFSRFC